MTKPKKRNEGDYRLAISIAEASKRLGLSKNSLYASARIGQLPSINIGRRILIPLSALKDFLESKRAE